MTGAARGIGRAVSVGLLEAGASLVAADRAWDGAEATRREFEASGRALIVTFDLNDAAAVAIARDRALDRFGRVDILVNNAALRMRDLFFAGGPLDRARRQGLRLGRDASRHRGRHADRDARFRAGDARLAGAAAAS